MEVSNKKTNKLLSISIAAYNVEKYLSDTLDSLIVPEIMNKLEVLIVNDGSKDKTSEIADYYVEKYPDTFIHINKENGGWGSTINASIKIATGKYYKLLDGDDWFDTSSLKAFIDQLEKIDADLVFTQYTKVYEPEMSSELIEQKYEYNKNFEVAEIDTYCMHAIAVKTNLLKEIPFYITEKCFYTDVEFFVKCVFAASNAISIPINVYRYRLGRAGQSVSIESMIKRVKEHDFVVRKVLPIVYEAEKLKGLKEDTAILVERHFDLLLCLQSTGENKRLFFDFIELLKKDYPQSMKKISFPKKLALHYPKIFYPILSKIKRKKNKLETK